jgi:hypothetical protein
MIDRSGTADQSSRDERLRRSAARAFDGVVRHGATLFDRALYLPRVLPGFQEDDLAPQARRRTLARLARALRMERQRGRAGHWSYDLNRHIALAQAYESERRRLAGTPPPESSG